MMRTRYAVLIGAVLLANGCGWFNDGEGLIRDTKDDYLEVAERPPLKIPDDLRSLEDTDPFPIPNAQIATNPRFYPRRPPLPDAIYANDNREEVRIQRLGERRWLVIPEPATTVWPKIKQFLAENGVSVPFEDPDHGRLNTEWVALEDQAYRDVVRTAILNSKRSASLMEGQDRYLIKVEQGLRDFSTEVHVRHENDSLTLPVEDDTQALSLLVSDIADAEDTFLNEIGAYIVAKVSEQTVSKVAQQIGSSRKAELARDPAGLPYLRLYLDYDRAWATMGQALTNAEVTINALDRDTGVYAVSIPEALLGGEDEKGFLCRVTFSCGSKDSHELQIQLTTPGQSIFDVRVADEAGAVLADPDLAQQVLVLLREFAA